MSLALRPIGHSEIGLVRKSNQDSGFVSPTLLFVADGMGGAAAGDLASAVTANEVQHANDIPMAGKGALTALRIAVVKANNDLAELILRAPELDGMGTTICGGIFDGQSLNLAHIGDSRGYLLRDGALKRLTHDHSYVQTLIDDGRLDEEGALIHPHRSLIMKVLNGQPDIAPDYFSVDLREGDRIMFCSDGLCGLARDADIAKGLSIADLAGAMTSLIRLAHDHGGTDNITIILADVIESAPNAPSAVQTGAEEDADDSSVVPTSLQPVGTSPTSSGATASEPSLTSGNSGVAASATDSATSAMDPATSGSPTPPSGVASADTSDSTPGAGISDLATPGAGPSGVSSREPSSPDSSPALEQAGQPGDRQADNAQPSSEADDSSDSTGQADQWNDDSLDQTDLDDGATTLTQADQIFQTSGLLGAAADPSLEELLNILHHHGARAAATARPSATSAAQAMSDEVEPKKPERKSLSAITAQQEQERYRPGGKRSHLAVWLIILAAVVVLGGGGWGVYTYVTHQYYVGDHEGEVAIFAGIPGDVAGIATNRVYESTDIKLTDLPLVWRDKVTGIIPIDFNDLEQANSTVDQLRSLSEQCLDRRDKRPPSDPIPADGC